MANTKVTGDLIANSTIATGNIADNAVTSDKISGITTAHITEGANLYYTDARADARAALLVDSAPSTLNTLNELAAALGDDPNFATTVTNSIATKMPIAGGTFTGNITGVGASLIGTAASGTALVTIENNSGSTATSYGLLVIGGGNSSNGRTFEVRDASGNTDLIVKGNGKIGIGTASPDNILHIRNGDTTYASQVGADTMLFLETTNVSNALQFTSANTGQQYIMFGDDDPNVGWISYNHSDNNLNFRVNGSEKMRITSAGDIQFTGNSHTPYIQLVNSGRTEGNPGYTFNNDTNTGMFQPAGVADTIAFSTGGSERIRIENTGVMKFANTATSTGDVGTIAHYTNNYMYIRGGTGGLAIGDDGFDTNIYLNNNSSIQLQTAGSERMRWLADGQFWIKLLSTTSGREASMANDNDKLQIFGSRHGGTGKYVSIWSDGANENTRFYPTKTVFYKDVGIGTTSPSHLLHLKSTATGATGIIIENTNNAQVLDIDFWSNAGSAQGRIRYEEGPGAFGISPNVGSPNAMYINYSNNVGIGTTSPGNKLTIASGTGGGSAPDSRTLLHIDKDGEAYISINSPAESFNGIRLNVAGTPKAFVELYDNTAQGKKLNIGTVDARDLVFDTGNQPKMTILAGGNVGIGTADPDHKLEVVGGLALRNSNSRLYFGTNNGTDRRALEGSVDGALLQVGESYNNTRIYGVAQVMGATLAVGDSTAFNTYQGISAYGSNPSLALRASGSSSWCWTEYRTNGNTNNFSMGVNQTVPYWGVKNGAGLDNPVLKVKNVGGVTQTDKHENGLYSDSNQPPAVYLGKSGNVMGTGGIYRLGSVVSSSTTNATNIPVVTTYSSGHWGAQPTFFLEFVVTYYRSSYVKYWCQHTVSGTTIEPMHGPFGGQMTSSPLTVTVTQLCTNCNGGQPVYKAVWKWTNYGTYLRTTPTISIQYGAGSTRIYTDGTSTESLIDTLHGGSGSPGAGILLHGINDAQAAGGDIITYN